MLLLKGFDVLHAFAHNFAPSHPQVCRLLSLAPTSAFSNLQPQQYRSQERPKPVPLAVPRQARILQVPLFPFYTEGGARNSVASLKLQQASQNAMGFPASLDAAFSWRGARLVLLLS